MGWVGPPVVSVHAEFLNLPSNEHLKATAGDLAGVRVSAIGLRMSSSPR